MLKQDFGFSSNMFTAFAFCAGLLILATLLPLSRNSKWWIRGLDFPRLQLAIGSGFLVILELSLLELTQPASWWLIVPTILCFAYQAWWILPYTKLVAPEVEPAEDELLEDKTSTCISIITANVLMTNRNARKLLELVRQYQPDILVTLESNDWWQSHLDQLSEQYPHAVKCPLDNLYGMHLYSRRELINTEIQYLVEKDVPSIHACVKLAQQQIRLHCLHPAPPSPTENEESSERDAELVMVAKNIEKTKDSSTPIIVTGDMNDVAWSRTTRLFRKISGLLDPRIGRGMFNTFHADYWFMRWPLDHLFHSEHFTLRTMQRLPGFGSDHFALYTELALVPHKAETQSGIDKEAGDEEMAQEILQGQQVSSDNVVNPTRS